MIPADAKAIDHLIESFREAGDMDSQGVFTLSGRRAVGKLAKSLLIEPSDWILKVTQGACRAQAPHLKISQTKKATHIHFDLPFRLDIKDLEESLVAGTSSLQPGIEELSSGLRAVGLGQDRAWVARFRTDQTVYWLLVQRGQIELETTVGAGHSSGDHTEVLLGIAFPVGQLGKLGGILRFGSAIQNEHATLRERARACSIPLSLDGHRVDNLRNNEPLGSFEKEALLGISCPTPTPEELQRLPAPITIPKGLRQASDEPYLDRFHSEDPFYLSASTAVPDASSVQRWAYRYHKNGDGPSRGGRNATRHVPLPTPSRIYLVRFGVIVGRRNLGITEPIVADVFMCANHLRSDLSGLEAEVTPEILKRARSEIARCTNFLEHLQSELGLYRPKPTRKDLMLLGGIGATALLMSPWLLKLALVPLCAVRLRSSAQHSRQVLEGCLQHLQIFAKVYGK